MLPNQYVASSELPSILNSMERIRRMNTRTITVALEADDHQALRVHAAQTDQSMTEIVSRLVQNHLRELRAKETAFR